MSHSPSQASPTEIVRELRALRRQLHGLNEERRSASTVHDRDRTDRAIEACNFDIGRLEERLEDNPVEYR